MEPALGRAAYRRDRVPPLENGPAHPQELPRRVKCLYLAAEAATAFYEIYGDDLTLAKESGTTAILTKQALLDHIYAAMPAGFALKVYKLTTDRPRAPLAVACPVPDLSPCLYRTHPLHSRPRPWPKRPVSWAG